MIEAKKFDEKFYDSQADGSYNSALAVLPIIDELIHPRSVLDVGCGVGTWLKVWKENLGVEDVIGIDGDYVSRESLRIPQNLFDGRDLKLPFDLGRKFDLAMSVEVGEHLPIGSAGTLVDNLVKHADLVVFSSANLQQRGTYHINEQPPEFWAKLFTERNYVPVDIIRDEIWNDDRVEWWYRQNIIVYTNRNILHQFPALEEKAKHTFSDCLFRIHPLLWKYRNEEVDERSQWLSFLRWKLSSLRKNLFSNK
jgi:SAM-dependent methyltransferase